MLLLALTVLLALAVSASFSTAELAVFSVGESRLRVAVEEGYRGSRALARLRERTEPLLVLFRLGRTLGTVLAASLAGAFASLAWGTWTAVIVVVALVLAVLILTELISLRMGAQHSLRIALAVAPPLLWLVRILAPLLVVLDRVSRLGGRPPGEAARGMTETEVQELTRLGETEGKVEEQERQLVERAFRLDETKAWDIMAPRVDIFAWPDSLTLDEIAGQLRTVPFSRVPVYGESIDDITGVLYLRDAYQAVISGQGHLRLRALAREPLIVPGSMSLAKLLHDFQTRRIHLAVVVDEYGGTDGLVTLEDVLEELVGEIVDETDIAEEPILRVSRNEIVAAGDADLREINHVFNTSFPQLEHRSLNGYVLEELGRVPRAGETLERDGIRIEIVEATETQVVRARLVRVAAPAEGAEAATGSRPAGASRTPADGAEEEAIAKRAAAEARAETGPPRRSDGDGRGKTSRSERRG